MMPIPALRRTAVRLALLVAVACGPAVAQEGAAPPPIDLGEDGYAAVVRSTIEGAIRPGYRAFADDAATLGRDVAALCTARDGAALDRAHTAFEATVRGYFALLPMRIGPILSDNRQERLAFWPDPRGLSLKQINQLVAAKDASATDPAALPGKSVGVQGLTALEYLLYGTGADTLVAPGGDGDWRCAYATAVAANVDRIAAEMADAWTATGEATRLLTEPGAGNPMFLTHEEAAAKLVATAASGLELLSDSMVVAVFGTTPDKAKPKLAPFWRSGQSIASVAAALRATRAVIAATGLVDRLPRDRAYLGTGVLFQLKTAAANADKVTHPVAVAVTDEADRNAMRYVAAVSTELKSAIGRDLAAAFGFEQGFNAHDGD